LPQAHDAIIAATGHPGAAWIPGHTLDSARVRATDPAAGARRHVPHLHSLLIAPTGKPLPVRTPRHSKEVGVDVVGISQDLHTGSCARVPHPDGIAPPAIRNPPTLQNRRYPLHIPAS